ncbi:MAG: large conductance mechanosensitive channel protein MscL [Actinomycetota bacterium]
MDELERVGQVFTKRLKRRAKVLGEFKAFISRSSAMDLAVGVVIGAAFNTVVQSLVKDVLTPIISVPGTANFDRYLWCLKDAGRPSCENGVALAWGVFLTTVISFLLTSAAVFFFVLRPMNKLRERRKGMETPTTRECPECLSTIPRQAIRCSQCAQPVVPATAG